MTSSQISKNNTQALNLFNSGLEYFDAGKLEKAERQFLAAHNLAPDRLSVVNNLVAVLIKNKRWSEAKRYSDVAIDIDPDDQITVTDCAFLHHEFGQLRQGIQLLSKQLEIKNSPDMLQLLGSLFQANCEYQLALDAYRAAIKVGKANEYLLVNQLTCLSYLGRFHDALQFLSDHKSKFPQTDILLYSLSLIPWSDSEQLFTETMAAYESTEPVAARQENTLYLFSKSHESHEVGLHRQAWEYIETANSIVATKIVDKTNAESKIRDSILHKLKNTSIRLIPDEEKSPISLFILGTSRSGKSTFESIFCNATNSKKGFENKLFDNTTKNATRNWNVPAHFFDFEFSCNREESIRVEYMKELGHRIGSAQVFTSTMPSNLMLAHRIAAIIPNSRFVFIKRNFEDVCMRIFMRSYDVENYYSYDLKRTREYVDWYSNCIDLLVPMLPGRCVVTSYEEIVTSTRSVVESVAELCGVECEVDSNIKLANDIGCAEPYLKYLRKLP